MFIFVIFGRVQRLRVYSVHVIIYTACNAQCNQGDMRCFGPDPDECCSFYDPHDKDKCLNECPPDRLITGNMDCAGIII